VAEVTTAQQMLQIGLFENCDKSAFLCHHLSLWWSCIGSPSLLRGHYQTRTNPESNGQLLMIDNVIGSERRSFLIFGQSSRTAALRSSDW